MSRTGSTIRSAKMNAITPPKLIPPFHSTAASGTFPTEQTREWHVSDGANKRCDRDHWTDNWPPELGQDRGNSGKIPSKNPSVPKRRAHRQGGDHPLYPSRSPPNP